ncbi:SLC13 family permease [Nodosilinea sp. LEGE 07298]|uniref:SLC13 family permease n=1 Tax=Nodosilinea sp. LEGE 07298 TaxID=2777970 RepID=UPI00187E1899|nr:SLC13 family permease [Nodosilinea sp. LEGE 07298]MBE9113480.1 SLC13 family permease [Nodosilinea sp. LEGE 07298]
MEYDPLQDRQRFNTFSTPNKIRQRALLIALGAGVVVIVGSALALGLISLPAQLTWAGWLTIGVTLAAFLLNALTPLPAEAIFLAALATLLLSGVLDTTTALAGFSNPGMMTVGVLYIVVAGLQQTGGLDIISRSLLGLPKGQTTALLRLLLPVLGLSAFLNNTPLVAMFIPVVSDWCRKLRISPSKLMIPLSYAAIMGGMCTLIGTSTNLVVNGLLVTETDYPGLNLFDLVPVGVPCAIAGSLMLVLAQRWVLPQRKPAITDADDPREYTVEMVVEDHSPLAGKTVEQAGLRHLPGLYLTEIQRQGRLLTAIGPQETLQEQDQLVFVGMVDSIVDLNQIRGLQPATDQVFKLDTPRTERTLIEAVVSNTCPLVGVTIRQGKFRSRYGAVVLAVGRNGERLPGKIGDIRLQTGDTLLLETNHAFLEERRASRDFYLVSEIPNSDPLRHDRAPIALAILVLMVALATSGWMDMLHAATLAALLMVILGCCSFRQGFRTIDWSVLLVVAAALGLGKALEVTGAAAALAGGVLSLGGDNPWLALIIVYGVTTVLTEVITNNAAAAVVFPIALSLSQSLGVSFIPFVVSIMIAASASFSTPIGYQTNLMVYGPGGYKFTDFLRVGIPFNLAFWLLTVLIAPRVYPF